MIRSLTVENFRTFQHFSMQGLGRINLCVGTNNCGKTSILEAVHILAGRGHTLPLWQTLYQRGELSLVNADENLRGRTEVDICHLFNGRTLGIDSTFKISALNDGMIESVSASIADQVTDSDSLEIGEDLSRNQTPLFSSDTSENSLRGKLTLNLDWAGPNPLLQKILISQRGSLTIDTLDRIARKKENDTIPTVFVTTKALRLDQLLSHFESIVLTPEEDIVIDALRTIEPTLERIAPVTDRRRAYPNDQSGSFVVRLHDNIQRIPIGSMGDGILRMLGIALSLTRARGGILLVDEIDTGLHFSVMEDMWRLVCETAKRLDVQVFATTHSRDCVESLKAISRPEVTFDSEVSIQRIERGSSKAVSFTERDIVIASDRSIEIR
jgi:ABC-type branched-subunit amino acid transport system ATPase component